MPKTDMYDQTRIKMKYLFHNEWKEKFVAWVKSDAAMLSL